MQVERENQDLYLEQIRLKAKEHRSTVMEGISTAGSVMGAGFQAFLNDWDKVVVAAGGASLLALGYFTAKRATGRKIYIFNIVTWHYIVLRIYRGVLDKVPMGLISFPSPYICV